MRVKIMDRKPEDGQARSRPKIGGRDGLVRGGPPARRTAPGLRRCGRGDGVRPDQGYEALV